MGRRNIRLAPSILAADFAQLGDEIRAVDTAGADYIHLDVMDGQFVPNLSFGPPVIRALRPLTKKTFDAHLMVNRPDRLFGSFAEAGVNIITIHPEAVEDLGVSLDAIRKLNCRAGVAINPETPMAVLMPVMDKVDLILVMTVSPGFGGQAFLPLHAKIRQARGMIDGCGREVDLEVDGGINDQTAAGVIDAGADVLVSGTYVFKGGPATYADALKTLRGS